MAIPRNGNLSPEVIAASRMRGHTKHVRSLFGPTPWWFAGGWVLGGMAWHLSALGALVPAFLAAGGFWWFHSWLQPLITCRNGKCQGGRIWSGIWGRRYHNHAGCEGRGRYPRLGYRVFHGMGAFPGSAEQTGPGWRRVRDRAR